ncbi:MAG: phosphoglycerate mutase [Thermomonas sp.]|nr:phosphoglycerate mutase [Thermomonas sp.]
MIESIRPLILLLPPLQKFGGTSLPERLAKALAQADRGALAAGEEAQLLRYFKPLPLRLPYAPLSRVTDIGLAETRDVQWLRADPAHIRPDINGARLLGIGRTVGIEQSDVDALLPALRPLFGDLGMLLDAPSPERWYLKLAAGATLPTFASPEQALGDDVFEHIPDGPEARRWRLLLNETQIVLHNHPHNEARLAAGRVPINSLWFWGGGALPDSISTSVTQVFSDEAGLRGAARLARIACGELSDYSATPSNVLIDLRQQRDWAGLIQHWLLPAAHTDAVLDFADGAVFTLRSNQRWRFWRKPLRTLQG